jgi:hypothetical protein
MLPKGTRSVTAISFNRTSKLLAFSDFSNDNNIYVLDWQKSELVTKVKSGVDKIFMIDWSLTSDTEFCTVGKNKVRFYNTASVKNGSVMKAEPGNLGDPSVSI